MSEFEDMEIYLCEVFEQNYERLRMEGGQPLSESSKESAWKQVLHYWKKLQDLAQKVTETEIQLNLPNQQTPRGHKYNIEGVVDVVREDDETTIYDIKTTDRDYINGNLELFEKQLNVYAHIWQNLQGQPLDKTAVIATGFPFGLKEALNSEDEKRIEESLQEWNPVIEIPLDFQKVEEIIEHFGQIVDKIEDNEFAPPPVEKLKTISQGSNTRYADRVCGNCDARHSCSSFLRYAKE